ncbi:MAG: hypothetical protein LH649_16750 [Pseudanabaena sp. CAN_BIN31]|jgi:hypothetical protein|nr:hypothetical protein [Pseudanabaena sp. CAN_BIN31]
MFFDGKPESCLTFIGMRSNVGGISGIGNPKDTTLLSEKEIGRLLFDFGGIKSVTTIFSPLSYWL